jgi:hypothetical protein
MAMPHRQASRSAPRSFRQRYNELEARRDALLVRLQRLGDRAQQHPGYRRALKLLNDTFRKAKLAQRLAVLQAAAWLIDVLEQLSGMV